MFIHARIATGALTMAYNIDYTHEIKIAIYKAIEPLAGDIANNLSMQAVTDKAAIQVTGERLSYYIIRKWAKMDEELGELLSIALLRRAETYCEMSQKELNNIKDNLLIDIDHIDAQGNLRTVRKERMSAVNHAKLMIEHYIWHMGKLAPDLYGDYVHELRAMQDTVKELKSKIDAITAPR